MFVPVHSTNPKTVFILINHVVVVEGPDQSRVFILRSACSSPYSMPLDGFTVRRKGDVVTRIRVVHMKQQPEMYKLQPH